MSVKIEATRLLHNLGGGDLMGRTHLLRPAQRKIIAEFVHRHGMLPSAQALWVDIDELERCLDEAGFRQCEVCEQVFEMTESTCESCREEVQ